MTWLSSSSNQNSSISLSVPFFSAHVPVKELPTLLSKAKFSVHIVPVIGRWRYWIIFSKPRRYFETEKWSRQFHKVQLWSLLWETYTQAGRIRRTDDPEAFAAALRAAERGTGGFKGAKAKNRIWLLSEKHNHTKDGAQGFSVPQGSQDH